MPDLFADNQNRDLPDERSKFQFIPISSGEMGYPHNTGRGGNAFDPKDMVSLILRYKWLVMFSIIVGAAGAWFYADNLEPAYESNGTILITSSNASLEGDLAQAISQATGFGTGSTLANEIQILRSREFSRQAARELIEQDPGDTNTYPILWRRTESGEVYRATEEQVAGTIRNNLSFGQPEEESDVVEVRYRSSSPEEAATIVNNVMGLYVENSTQQNRQAARTTADFLQNEKLQTEQKLHDSEERLQNFMDETGIVQIDDQATSVIQQRASNEEELMRINLELQTTEQAISTHESELEEIRPGLIDQISAAIGPRIRDAQDNLSDYESERTLYISKNPNVLDLEPLPERLRFLNAQIQRLSEEIKSLSNQLITDNNEFIGLDSGGREQLVVDLQRQLVDLRIDRNQYMARRDALLQYKAEMDANFNSLPEELIQLAKLQRDVNINEEMYLNVSRQYADMSVWVQSQFGFGRIIDRAEITNAPVYPNKKMLMILGVMLGGIFSVGFIYVRDFMDHSVKGVDQLRAIHLPAPILSVIPSFDKIAGKRKRTFTVGEGQIPDELVLLSDRSSYAAESIRRLKNNLIYQNGHNPPKSIAITSPEKKDGKSTVAANLGVAFAEEGYKTLLIDADFRRPKLHSYLGLTDNVGLTDYFAGKLPYDKLIKNTDVNSLKLICAGSEVKRPDSIISSKVFQRFKEKMEEVYDIVIFDTAPFGILSDSAGLLKDSEALILVVGHRKTNKDMLLSTMEELERIKADVTGLVLNDFDHKKETGYYHGNGQYKALYSSYEAYVS